jgi:hypothetical protein
MSACIKIGTQEWTGEQVVSALTRFNQLESFVGNVLLESLLESIPLSDEELFFALTGEAPVGKLDHFQDFLATFLRERNISNTFYEWRIRRELQLAKLKRVKFDKNIEPEFLRRKSDFDQVKFLLIQTSDGILAQEIFLQIRDGEASFGDLAEQYSEGSEKNTQGIVGPMKLSALPENIAQMLRKNPIYNVFGPIKVGDSHWIIQVEALLEARLTEAVRNEIRDQLFNHWLTSNVRAMMADPQKVMLLSGTKNPPELSGS